MSQNTDTTSESSSEEFVGFGREALGFLRDLQQNNTREYFEANRSLYDAAIKAPLKALLKELALGFATSFKLFRQERDVRFSRDKSPYKLKTYGVVGSRPGSATAHYVELAATGLFAASGYYDMQPDQLARYRTAVADDALGPELERLLKLAVTEGLEVSGAQGGAPRGTPPAHPRRELLRYRSLLYGARLAADAPELYERAALGFVTRTWERGAGVSAWLDRHVGKSSLPAAARRRR